jgi:hypothetical protein
MQPKLLAPLKVTSQQRDWLEAEKTKTGNSYSAIIRTLIQAKIKGKGQ